MGLELEGALCALRAEGIEPQVTLTSAPKRREETGGVLRIVYASDDGRRLTVSRFLDPIAEHVQENG